MGRIRLAYPRSRMTARLGSFLHRVESGAQRVARALERLRSKTSSWEPPNSAPLAEQTADAGDGVAAPPEDGSDSTPLTVTPPPAPSASAPSPAAPSGPATLAAARAAFREAELPDTYGRSRVVVLAIDPHHVHAYWEVTPADARAARAKVNDRSLEALTWVLRFYDVTRATADISSAHGQFDVEVDPASRNWYIELWSPDKTYLVELGVRLSSEFIAVCRANPVIVPPARLSQPRAPEWRIADPERATTHAVAPSDPRLPQPASATAETPVPETARSLTSGAAFSFSGEQPWLAATRGLGTENAAAAEVSTSNASPAGATAALEPRAQHGALACSAFAEPAEPSLSVSLSGLAAGSGSSRTPGGDSRA